LVGPFDIGAAGSRSRKTSRAAAFRPFEDETDD
jgi:hypothetical protein